MIIDHNYDSYEMEEKYSNFFRLKKILRISHRRFKSDKHEISTINVKKIALSFNNDKKYKHLIIEEHFHMELLNK